GDRPAGEAVARRAGEDDLVAEERLEDDRALPARGADDPELELARGHPLDDVLGVVDRERDGDARVAALELGEKERGRGGRRAGTRRGPHATRRAPPTGRPIRPRRAAPRARAGAARRGRGGGRPRWARRAGRSGRAAAGRGAARAIAPAG